MNCGTIFVDLERHRVADLLADRDRYGRLVQAVWKQRLSAAIVPACMRMPRVKARRRLAQVADRFHLLKNLRETIARQLGGFEAAIREAPLSGAEDDRVR